MNDHSQQDSSIFLTTERRALKLRSSEPCLIFNSGIWALFPFFCVKCRSEVVTKEWWSNMIENLRFLRREDPGERVNVVRKFREIIWARHM